MSKTYLDTLDMVVVDCGVFLLPNNVPMYDVHAGIHCCRLHTHSIIIKTDTVNNVIYSSPLRGMAMRRIFWVFCRNWFLIDPLHYLSSSSDFGFEFAEIFVIEKRLPGT